MVFQENLYFLSKIAKCSMFAPEGLSNGINSKNCRLRPNYEVFCQKKKNLNVGKITKMMKKECSCRKKKIASFTIASLPNWVGANFADASRPSCLKMRFKNKKLLIGTLMHVHCRAVRAWMGFEFRIKWLQLAEFANSANQKQNPRHNKGYITSVGIFKRWYVWKVVDWDLDRKNALGTFWRNWKCVSQNIFKVSTL